MIFIVQLLREQTGKKPMIGSFAHEIPARVNRISTVIYGSLWECSPRTLSVALKSMYTVVSISFITRLIYDSIVWDQMLGETGKPVNTPC